MTVDNGLGLNSGSVSNGGLGSILLAQPVFAQTATDNFNRANGSIAGANGWAANSDGSATIISNELSGVGASRAGNYRTTGTYASNQYATATVGSVNSVSGSYVGLALRHNAATNAEYVGIYFNSSGTLQLGIYQRTVAGGYTNIGTVNISVLPVGTLLTFYVFGSVLVLQAGPGGSLGSLTVTDLTIPSGGVPGVTTFGTMTLDNWAGGNLTMGGALGPPIASDNFNRANGNVATGQPLWTPITSTFSGVACTDGTIVSNEVNNSSATHQGDSRGDTYGSDHWSQVVMGSVNPIISGTPPFIGALLRWNGSQGYQCCYFAGGTGPGVSHRIYLLQAGQASTLLAAIPTNGNGGSPSPSTPNATVFKAVANGSRISMMVNECEVLAVNDPTCPAGQPGYLCYPSITVDNFSAGNVKGGGNSYVNAVLTDLPVAYYRLNDVGTSAVDQMGGPSGAYSGTYTQSSTNLLPTQSGASTNFGGGQMAVPDSAPLRIGSNFWTVECWLNAASFPSFASLIDGLQRAFSLFFVDSQHWDAFIGGTANNGAVIASAALATATTYHLAVVYDGTTNLTTYVNGVANNNAGSLHGATNSSSGFTVAGNPSGGGTPMLGRIQEVAVYNYPLQAGRISAHYACG